MHFRYRATDRQQRICCSTNICPSLAVARKIPFEFFGPRLAHWLRGRKHPHEATSAKQLSAGGSCRTSAASAVAFEVQKRSVKIENGASSKRVHQKNASKTVGPDRLLTMATLVVFTAPKGLFRKKRRAKERGGAAMPDYHAGAKTKPVTRGSWSNAVSTRCARRGTRGAALSWSTRAAVLGGRSRPSHPFDPRPSKRRVARIQESGIVVRVIEAAEVLMTTRPARSEALSCRVS
jgi:hypothetical protein